MTSCNPGYIQTGTDCACDRNLKLIVRCDDLGRYFFVQVKWSNKNYVPLKMLQHLFEWMDG